MKKPKVKMRKPKKKKPKAKMRKLKMKKPGTSRRKKEWEVNYFREQLYRRFV